jgi:hypothetical protein
VERLARDEHELIGTFVRYDENGMLLIWSVKRLARKKHSSLVSPFVNYK